MRASAGIAVAKGLLFLVLLTPLIAVPVESTIFRWVDSEGYTHYSDRFHPNAQEIRLKFEAPYYYVQQVYDGDTILLKGGSRVRLLGINTPEIEGHYRPEEAGGNAARDWLRQHLEGQKVRLEFDKERHDHYNRLLAHVFTAEGEHLNLRLVEEGLAVVNIIPPNLKYSNRLVQAQERAEVAKRGLWGMPDYFPQPITNLEKGVYLRSWQRYQGAPVAIRIGRKYVRLVFSKRVDVRISREQLHLFGNLERYLGEQIEVRGWVSHRQDHYSILIYHPSGLKQLFKKVGLGHRSKPRLFALRHGAGFW
jgi:micrococcal nuclease